MLVDSKGLLVASRQDLAEHKRSYAHDHEPVDDLISAVRALRPTALIGDSGQPHTFTRPVIEAIRALNERPLIFGLSNPTSKSECTAEQAYQWSGGRAIFASGGPFPAFDYQGDTFVPGQANNVYISPGVALGVIGVRRAARHRCHVPCSGTHARQRSQRRGPGPRPASFLRYTASVRSHAQSARAVIEIARATGLSTASVSVDIEALIKRETYDASYQNYL